MPDKEFAIYQDSVKSFSAGSSFTSPGYLIDIHGFNYYSPRGASKKYPRSTKDSETFSYGSAGSFIVCKYQASGGISFQFGHNWEVKLPVKKEEILS